MLSFLEQKIVQPDKVAGVEIDLLSDGRMLLYTVTLGIKKGKIIKEAQSKVLSTIDELLAQVNTGIPLAVCINGKGILTKQVETLSEPGNAVAAILPNVNPGDFFYEVNQQEGFDVVSIARKSQVAPLLDALRSQHHQVLLLGFGFTSLISLLPLMNHLDNGRVITNRFSLSIDDQQKVQSFTAEAESPTNPLPEYSISDQYLPGTHLLAFAIGVQLLTDNLKQTPLIQSPAIAEARAAYRFRQLFRTAGLALLAFIFVLLLINFLIYNHYFTLNREMEVKQQLSRDVQVKTKTLLHRIGQKERFLQRTGWEKNSRISLYADRIASLTPSNTLLTSMAVHPLKSNLDGTTTGLQFKYDTIQVNGASSNPVEVNQFINNLKIIPEFKEVSIKNYLYRKEEETGIFLIEIITR